MTELRGIGVAGGRAAGPVAAMPTPVGEPASGVRLAAGEPREAALARLSDASVTVREALDARATAAQAAGRTAAAELLRATAMMAADPTLLDEAITRIRSGHSPERAVWESAQAVADQLSGLGGYPAERVRDVQDVRDRLIAAVTGRPDPGIPVRDQPFVLVAADLAPADTATLDPADVLALVTERGGPTSHTAILARALGLPAVVAVHGATAIRDGTMVLVDGVTGTVQIEAEHEQVESVSAPVTAFSVRGLEPALTGGGRTADGHRVALYANVGDPGGVEAALAAGAEGIGLFRTEFCFLDRARPPTVAEQIAAYTPILSAFGGRRVVVRTLDAGADKPLAFLSPAGEPNPALGVRGQRTSRRAPEILADQLAAIAGAAADTDAEVWVMAPMVATAEESAVFAGQVHEAGLPMAGVMIEIPSAALTAEGLLRTCDFASIGTNDLSQYAMAADRQLGDLAELNDPWQPAVLALIEMAASAGLRTDRPVGVCGEAAADPLLACVLVGMGVTSLSMTPRALPGVAAQLAEVSRAQCVQFAGAAVSGPTATAARERVMTLLGSPLTRPRLPRTRPTDPAGSAR